MIHRALTVIDDAGLIVEQGTSINATSDRTSVVDLLLHGICSRDATIIRDGDVGEMV